MPRKSHVIRRQQATFTKPAIDLAVKLNLPLNQFVTITFDKTASSPEVVGKQFAKIREYYGKWARRPRKGAGPAFAPTHIWVVENTAVVAVHWLVHVPKKRQRDFKKRLDLWISNATEQEPLPGAAQCKTAYRPYGARKYMLKGIDPAVADLYRIRHIPQGMVVGKRLGFSKNLGPSQCRLHGTKKPWRRPGYTTHDGWKFSSIGRSNIRF
jgi:hypothetical protein